MDLGIDAKQIPFITESYFSYIFLTESSQYRIYRGLQEQNCFGPVIF